MASMRGRLAPSPTGQLHLGNARTALLAWLQVRSAGGELVMRVEDVDRGRCRPEYEAQMLADLRWLGLDWDEGPDVGGPHGSYRQSERGDLYATAAARLDNYACSCTRAELRGAARRPDGEGVVYPGYCRQRGPRDGRQTALRWRVPEGRFCWRDPLAGDVEAELRTQVGDQVLRRRDGYWAYLLAVVVDDAAMGITHVLRGADLLTATPLQLALFEALGHRATPDYGHVPLLLEAPGNKLSKRERSPSLAQLRDRGIAPELVVGHLAVSLGLCAQPEPLRPEDLIAGFELTSLPRAADHISEPNWFELLGASTAG